VHMCISIRRSMQSEVIWYLKGKTAIAVARQFGGRQRNFSGEDLWARGYAVSAVGFELAKVKEYIVHQEKVDSEQEEGRF
jgi:putative transposase